MEKKKVKVKEKLDTMTGVQVGIKAPRGSKITCKSWQTEAALRMLMNNLDPEVAEKPSELVVYGVLGKRPGIGRLIHLLVKCLRNLENDETLLVQSGKPVGIFRTTRMPSSSDFKCDARSQMGQLGEVQGIRGTGAHDVWPDDSGKLDLHRDPGNPSGDLRNICLCGEETFRRDVKREAYPLSGSWWNGRRSTFGSHHEWKAFF